MDLAYKFGWISNGERRYEYPDVWALEKTTGPGRLVIAPAARHVSIMLDLMEVSPEPFCVLYILTVPRSEDKPGRYESALVSREEAKEFLSKFRDFFENDARHHIWIKSIDGPDLLVYDKHNVIYAYGPLREYQRVLESLGLMRTDRVRFPDPHVHKYNILFDEEQLAILRYWDWKWCPLKDSDD